MKKAITFLLSAAILICILPVSVHADGHEMSARSAIVLCADTGDVLFEKNADEHMLIASITKIMTAIVVIENCGLDEEIIIKPEWSAIEGSSMYANPYEAYTVRELLTGMMLASGNDAAAALACSLCGDELSFAVKMNEKAAELGMKDSSFRNPHGLDDPEHYSTARDMARLTAYCMKNEEFKSIVSSPSAVIKDVTYYNHNRLLREYDGCIGVKTGYTVAAGRTLVSCAERGGMRLICVTLDAPDDWNDHKYLLDEAFADYRLISYCSDSFNVSLPVASAMKTVAHTVPKNDIRMLVKSGDDIKVGIEAPRMLFAGGIAGQTVGRIKILINGELAAQEDLVYTEDVVQSPDQMLSTHERFMRMLETVLGPYYAAGEER